MSEIENKILELINDMENYSKLKNDIFDNKDKYYCFECNSIFSERLKVITENYEKVLLGKQKITVKLCSNCGSELFSSIGYIYYRYLNETKKYDDMVFTQPGFSSESILDKKIMKNNHYFCLKIGIWMFLIFIFPPIIIILLINQVYKLIFGVD